MSSHSATPPPSGARPILRVAPLLLLLAIPLLWIYVHGIRSHAPKWEEPRRCMVAAEMIHRGDYVVPRVMGEAYRNKPPLYDWLIAVAAGFDADRVSAAGARAVSLTSLAGIAVLLAWAGSGANRRRDALPALLILGFALVVQNGRAGETDVLFCLGLTAAAVCFEAGRRSGSPRVQWGLSQGFVGLAALTKGLSPLFFYPPILWLAFRRPAIYRLRLLPILAGALLFAGVMASWLVPYSRLAPVAELQGRWVEEVLKLYVRPGWTGALRHLIAYPLLLLLVAAPWSAIPAMVARKDRRSALAGALADPWVYLCAVQAAWIALVYLFVPGVRGRYLMPMLPFVAVVAAAFVRCWESQAQPSRLTAFGRTLVGPGSLWATAGLGVVAVWVAGRELLPTHVGSLIAATAAIVVSLAALLWTTRRHAASPVLPLLALALVYGAVFVGVTESRRDERHSRMAETGRAFANLVPQNAPVVCDCHDSAGRKVAFALMQQLGRPLEGREYSAPHYRVTHHPEPPTAEASAVRVDGDFTLWRIEP